MMTLDQLIESLQALKSSGLDGSTLVGSYLDGNVVRTRQIPAHSIG